MEFEIEDRPQAVETPPAYLVYRRRDDRAPRHIAPRHWQRDQAVLIPDQEYGS